MANEVRLIEELRRLADLTPPICCYDRPEETEIFGEKITVYCKPFEDFQNTVRQAADRIEELESLRPKGRWVKDRDGDEYCENCSRYMPVREVTGDPSAHNYCPNCGAKMGE